MNTNALFKMLPMVLIGLVILLARDSIEIHKSNNNLLHETNKKSEMSSETVEVKHSGTTDGEKKGEHNKEKHHHQQQQQDENNNDGDNNNDILRGDTNTETTPKITRESFTPKITKESFSPMSSPTLPPAGVILPPEGVRTHSYKRRGQPLDDAVLKSIADEYGSWKNIERPLLNEDIYDAYPNRDIPRDALPPDAWQLSSEYLSRFLPEGIALVNRAINGIIAEYGQQSGANGEIPEMFRIHKFDITNVTSFSQQRGAPITPNPNGNGKVVTGSAGWTTPKSWEGLKRRLLHAIMTEDYFVFAMAGHSSAAGHGNHFIQSYTLQVQWILEAVFARLGVKHQARNLGHGGLGTLQTGMGAGSLFGPDVDMLMWDSSMTERTRRAHDLLSRQLLLTDDHKSEKDHKVPVLWSIPGASHYEKHAGADVGFHNTGEKGIPFAKTTSDVENLPWAVRYMDCDSLIWDWCKSNEYNGICWVDRDDYTPTTAQKSAPGDRRSWHYGNREHQLKGRVLAMTILQALREVLEEWNNAPDKQLEDRAWHVTEYYDAIRTKTRALKTEYDHCDEYKNLGIGYMCHYPMKARTEFTPRPYPDHVSIRTLMRPEMADLVKDNPPPEPVYNPPEMFNPTLHPPVGEVDVLHIVEAGGDFLPVLEPEYPYRHYKKPKFATTEPMVSPAMGKGIVLKTRAGDRFCDGSVDSWCGKQSDNPCLLYGHNDARNSLLFSSYSGWMVMNIPDLKNGYIAIKIQSWHRSSELTGGVQQWKTINNEEENNANIRRRHLQQRRSLQTQQYNNDTQQKQQQPDMEDSSSDYYDWDSLYVDDDEEEEKVNNDDNNRVSYNHQNSTKTTTTTTGRKRMLRRNLEGYNFCDGFRFEYAIDGKITSLDNKETVQRIKNLQRVVEVITLLEDPDYVTDGKETEVEVAIRMVGCGNSKVFGLTHIYWS